MQAIRILLILCATNRLWAGGAGERPATAPEPSRAARMLAENRQRAGWFRVGNRWVRPAATLRWGGLVRLDMRDGTIETRVELSEPASKLLRNHRTAALQFHGSDDLWYVSTKGRIWLADRKTASNHLSASAVAGLGHVVDGFRLKSLNVVPDRTEISGEGSLGGPRLRVSCILDYSSKRVAFAFSDLANGGPPVTRQGADFRQLLREYPDEVRRYLAPLFRAVAGENLLRPAPADVYRAFDGIEADPATAGRVEELLADLGSSDAPARDAAAARLDAIGPAAVLAVLRMEQHTLLPEERARLDRFITRHSLWPVEPGHARHDVSFLVDCLEDPHDAVRDAAAQLLQSVTGKPVGLHPSLSAEARVVAVEELRHRFLSDVD